MGAAQKKKTDSDVVIIFPYVDDKVLMQLRDDKCDIFFPGYWGFFGGSIDQGEQPKEAALRELKEEVGFEPNELHRLESVAIPELDNLMSHSFFCRLTASLEELKLKEGMDLGLFTIDEMLGEKLYSEKMRKSFPVVPLDYVGRTVTKLWSRINHNF